MKSVKAVGNDSEDTNDSTNDELIYDNFFATIDTVPFRSQQSYRQIPGKLQCMSLNTQPIDFHIGMEADVTAIMEKFPKSPQLQKCAKSLVGTKYKS